MNPVTRHIDRVNDYLRVCANYQRDFELHLAKHKYWTGHRWLGWLYDYMPASHRRLKNMQYCNTMAEHYLALAQGLLADLATAQTNQEAA